MKYRRLFQFLMAILLIIALLPFYQAPPAANAQEGEQAITRDTPYMPGEVVISFAAGSSPEQNAAVMDLVSKQFGVQPVRGEAQTVLLRGEAQLDVQAAAKAMEQLPGVEFAEPNYIYWIPEPAASPEGAQMDTEFIYRKAPEISPATESTKSGLLKVPVSMLQSMKTKRSNKIQAVYPNDDYLWWNEGWAWVGADIVSPNSTASANVCVIDTGVDYLHKDLAGKVIKGYDFISDDADPMDDHGHGTHVAGIIAAVKGNSEGIAGVSTGKVVAVKALTAQGWGTNFDVASAINYCGNRADVKVINMSLGGPDYSNMIKDAVAYAVNVRGKLIVASAGNDNSSTPSYPAYFAAYSEYANKVLAVGAAGVWEYDSYYDEYWLDYECRAEYSNYGSWVSVVAPGTEIYSLLPWDKPFYMSWGPTRYGSLSGTSMAAPFVAGAAARRWGYTPTATNNDVGAAVIYTGWNIYANGTCWPSSMSGKTYVNVAALLDRGAAYGSAFDASTGSPLTGASLYVYRGTSLLGSGIITPFTEKAYPWESDPNRVYTYFSTGTDIINLPANIPYGAAYTPKLHKSGYTASPQLAFHDRNYGDLWIEAGWWTSLGRAAVPPKSANFDIVMDSDSWSEYNFDLNVFLPETANPYDPGQPADFIVGPQGDAFGYLEGDSTGTLMAFPYARYRFGFLDYPPVEDIVIKKRSAHGIPANANLPYYAGTYSVAVTDYGQTIDHDGDGCGDNYGWEFDDSYTCSGTQGVSLLSYIPWNWSPLSVFVWKDGVIRYLEILDEGTCGSSHDTWWVVDIFSPPSSSAPRPDYYWTDYCTNAFTTSQSANPFTGRMEVSR